MADIYVPDGCALEVVAGRPLWSLHLTKPDGTGMRVHVPTSTPHWRCAEYDLDPADPHAVLDMILHELFVQATDPHAGVNIYALTADAARELHHGRIARAKAHATVDHRHPVFGAFYAGHGLSAEAVEPFRAHVSAHRQHHAAQPAVVDGGQPIGAPPRLHQPKRLTRPPVSPSFSDSSQGA